jgi:hypothetical protein
MVFLKKLALIGLVCRPSPKQPANQGGQWKGSLEGATSGPLMEAGGQGRQSKDRKPNQNT